MAREPDFIQTRELTILTVVAVDRLVREKAGTGPTERQQAAEF
jgi:hypothetical protein